MEEKTRLAKAAEYYASLGWKILPVHGITADGRCTCNERHTDPKDIAKHAAIGAWQTNATSDDATVEGWWRTQPNYNIGVMARSSGFLVIDIDPRSGGFESIDQFEQLLAGDGIEIPETIEAVTGNYTVNGQTVRGRHLFIKVPESENLKGNLKRENLPGIDIKHNGYVLLNPSRHFSGASYEWKPGHAPWEREMAEAPEGLLKILRKSGGGSSSRASSGDVRVSAGGWDFVEDLDWSGEKVDLGRFENEGIDEGSRAVDIYKMACALANKFGTDPAARMYIETMMIRFNHEKVRPPLELEGPNSLTMHVNRAIDFVAANPKTNRIVGGKEANAWAEKRKQDSFEKANTWAKQSITEAIGRMQGTSDPDDADGSDYEPAPGTLGHDVSSVVYTGGSVFDASARLDVPDDPDALTEEEGGTPGRRSLTDVGNARRFVDMFGTAIRYTPGLSWFAWNGQYWKPDAESLSTRELAKRIAPAVASEIQHYEDPEEQKKVLQWSNQAKGQARLNAAVDIATTDPRIIVEVEHWDNDPHLFGAANGVIDLSTGKLLQGRPDLHITRRAPVAYIPGVQNQRWQDFLDFGTDGDKDYQEWLQKAAGYTLTGRREHDVMFMVYGPPGSGKNVLIESLVKCMGSKQYAFPLDSTILAQNDGQTSQSDMYHWAELRGRRMVWVDELPESELLKENSVKKLTGSSEISARSPGEKPFTFQSQAKLWITTNHRPIIRDDAMWRRIRPIPWMKVPAQPDPGLKAYLFDPEGGLPAVLAWAVEGAMKLINSPDRDNLGWCKAVSDAAAFYKMNEDRIGMYLNEETNQVPGATSTIQDLYTVYSAWSKDRGEKPMSQIAFQRKLTDRGLNVTGQGKKATVADREIVPKTPTANIDWDLASRVAR